MIRCDECEHFQRGPGGQISFRCDPFGNIKESECLAKWQLRRTAELTQKMDRLLAAYEATLEIYRRFAPMQEKMFRHMEREIDEAEDADSWKAETEDEEEEEGPKG